MDRKQIHKLVPTAIRLSLRYRLLAFLLLSLLVLMSITMVVGQRTASHEFGEILDGQMISTGRAVFSTIVLELREGDATRIPDILNEFVLHRQGLGDWIGENRDDDVYDNEFYFQLNDPSGTSVFASHQPPLVQRKDASPGLFQIGTGENQWHLFGLQDAQTGFTFYTGQSQTLRHELSSESIEYILLPFVLVTIFILGSIWLGTRYGLKPLTQLTQELDTRSPAMLDTINLEGKATELRPMIEALNKLFTRVSTSLVSERQFSADASHELRTPLAGIKANLDAARCSSTFTEQEHYLNNIESCVDNATQVTEGLLLLSRLQSGDLEEYFDTNQFNIDELIQREINKRIALHAPDEARIQLLVNSLDKQTIFRGPESLVEVAVSNLLDNALKYSSGPVEIEVGIDSQQHIFISVKDDGTGIPEDKQEIVFQRFSRIDTDTTKGFGLGLALVQQIMHMMGGRVQLTNRSPSGLHAMLTLPASEYDRLPFNEP